MEKCIECNSEYDKSIVNIPTPLPDKMCAICGTILTDDQIKNLIESKKI